MDFASINGVSGLTNVSSDYIKNSMITEENTETKDKSFGSVFQSALGMVNETNELQNNAESAEIQFAMGQSNNTHDLQVAQQKANIALQYTVAVRDRVVSAYKEIMNMAI